MYNRKYLQKIQTYFEEGIMHEDELWSPIILYQAQKVLITDIEFYYYRQNETSIMHTANLYYRLKSLFRVTDLLIQYSDRFSFAEDNRELKSWWYVNIFRLYTMAFMLLSNVKDSSYILPQHYLDRFWRDCWQMIPEAVPVCKIYYRLAERELKKYVDWRISDRVASIDYYVRKEKKLMLIFNSINSEDLNLNIEDIPIDWVITTDRKYFQQANLVVFHLPSLGGEIENDIEKQEGQIWASWYLSSEENDLLVNDLEINELFDISINDQQKRGLKEHPLLTLCHDTNKLIEKDQY